MLKKLLLLYIFVTASFSVVISENIIFLQDDATHYANYSTTRTDYKEFNIRLKKGKNSLRKYLAPIVHSYPDDYRLNKEDINYDMLTYFSDELSTLKIKKFKDGHISYINGIYTFSSWIRPVPQDKHYGFWHNKKFYEFYYIWVLPKKYEFVAYKSNKIGKWKKRGNTLVYKGRNVNDLTFNISYKIRYQPHKLSDILTIFGTKSVQEGEVAKGYKAQLNTSLDSDLVINLVCDGIAQDGIDMQCPKQITIPKGKQSVTFKVKTIDDNLSEKNEFFNIRVDSIKPNKEVSYLRVDNKISSVNTYIYDEIFRYAPDEHTVYMSIKSQPTIKEGNSGKYSITLSQKAIDDTIIYLEYGGSATDKDYIPVKKLTIPKGKQSVNFTIKIKNDTIVELKEHFRFFISDVEGSGFEDLRIVGENSIITQILDNKDNKNDKK